MNTHSITTKRSASALLSHYDALAPAAQKLFLQWVQERDEAKLRSVCGAINGFLADKHNRELDALYVESMALRSKEENRRLS